MCRLGVATPTGASGSTWNLSIGSKKGLFRTCETAPLNREIRAQPRVIGLSVSSYRLSTPLRSRYVHVRGATKTNRPRTANFSVPPRPLSSQLLMVPTKCRYRAKEKNLRVAFAKGPKGHRKALPIQHKLPRPPARPPPIPLLRFCFVTFAKSSGRIYKVKVFSLLGQMHTNLRQPGQPWPYFLEIAAAKSISATLAMVVNHAKTSANSSSRLARSLLDLRAEANSPFLP